MNLDDQYMLLICEEAKRLTKRIDRDLEELYKCYDDKEDHPDRKVLIQYYRELLALDYSVFKDYLKELRIKN